MIDGVHADRHQVADGDQVAQVNDFADRWQRIPFEHSADERRYWVFNELNTKPAVTYLKKLERESELA